MEANNKAIREALEEIVTNIEMRASLFDVFSIIDRKTFLDAKSALAKPPRQCDVGTAKEQYARFVDVCHANVDLTGRCRESCPFRRVPTDLKCDRAECFALWAQKPCEEGGAS